MDLDGIIQFATQLHAGQLDKIGRPYIGHLERVATSVRQSGGTWVQEWAAWLHDSIEDTSADLDYLLDNGIPYGVANVVAALTHLPNEPNKQYWARVRDCNSAILVKQCDIYDNLNPARLCYLDAPTQNRLRLKYAKALKAISE